VTHVERIEGDCVCVCCRWVSMFYNDLYGSVPENMVSQFGSIAFFHNCFTNADISPRPDCSATH
jgi:hypothetical protein